MTDAAEVIAAIEELGGSVSLGEGGAIRFRVPKHNPHAQALLELLRQDKPALVAHLKSEPTRSSDKMHVANPRDSDLRGRMEASVRQFGHLHARLFPLIGQHVWTPQGTGKLLSVFERCCQVRPDRPGGAIFVRTEEVQPVH